jgi:polyhydroxyalkanoate synthesis regulator protein
LYDTETSAYITLAEVKQFVLDQQQFEVHDARTNGRPDPYFVADHPEEEGSGGAPMFSADMFSNIIFVITAIAHAGSDGQLSGAQYRRVS